MPYTPLIRLTDSELINLVVNKEDATTLETELMVRLDRFLDRCCDHAACLIDDAEDDDDEDDEYAEAA